MASLNKAIIIGYLGRDPEIRYFQDGNPVANFSVATTDTWTDKTTGERKERTEWHRIVAFGRLAEICGQYLAKGRQVYIEGRLQTREWEDRDGNKRSTTEIIANEMKMLGPKSEGPGGGAQGYQGRPQGGGYGAPPPQYPGGGYGGPMPQGPGGYQGGYGGPSPQAPAGYPGGYGGGPPHENPGYQGGYGGPATQPGYAGQIPSRRPMPDAGYPGSGDPQGLPPEYPEMGDSSSMSGSMPSPTPSEEKPGSATPPPAMPDEDDIPF